MEINKNINPLEVTTTTNLLHCGLIYHLDLLELLEISPLTVHHFTNIRLMLYLISLIPKFGVPPEKNLSFIKKIDPPYLRYALLQYHPFGIIPEILSDKEIYDSFINSKIPENYSEYNTRYIRLLSLHTIDKDILNIFINKLFKTTNLCKVVTQTVQSNLEKIIIESDGLLEMIDRIGMFPVSPDPHFDVRNYFLENLIDYIHHTDPMRCVSMDLFQSIESGMITEFLSSLSDQEIISITGAFVPYQSRSDLIRKITLLTSNTPRFFISKESKICYGTLYQYTEFTSAQLISYFKKEGFYNANRTIEFSAFDINQLMNCLVYYGDFHDLFRLCQQKIKKFK